MSCHISALYYFGFYANRYNLCLANSREIEEGGNPENTDRKPVAMPSAPVVMTNSVPSAVTTTAKATLMSPVAKYAMIKPSNAPPSFEFSLGHPANLAMVDMDVIKLTAQ